MELTVEEALKQGVTAHKEGRLDDAERFYRAILKFQPEHADANHNLGLLALSVGKVDAALPNQIYDLDYEDLTENQEEETRNLIGHLGIEWNDACLSPQDNTRSVDTASAVQVRQKVYQGSSKKWRRYLPFLNGALDHLRVDNQ